MTKLMIKGLPETWLFPTTRYRGSKRKILPWIYENLKDLEFDNCLDLFGGTGSVSFLLKRMGKSVDFNDYSYFNYTSAIGLLKNGTIIFEKEDIDSLFSKSKLNTKFISNNFNGFYFTDEENLWLDNVLSNILSLENKYSGEILTYKTSIATWALGQACLIKRPFNLFHRKNLNLRKNEVKRSFGNKTTWEKPFAEAFIQFINEANSIIFENGKKNEVYNFDARDFPENKYDLIYIDPPYFFPGQTDVNYLSLYHFLDGIAQYKEWDELIDYSSAIRSIKIEDKFKWPYKSPDEIEKIYIEIFSKFCNSIIVLSQKSGSLVSVERLSIILKKCGKNIRVEKIPYAYALNRQNGKSHLNTECLIIGS